MMATCNEYRRRILVVDELIGSFGGVEDVRFGFSGLAVAERRLTFDCFTADAEHQHPRQRPPHHSAVELRCVPSFYKYLSNPWWMFMEHLYRGYSWLFPPLSMSPLTTYETFHGLRPHWRWIFTRNIWLISSSNWCGKGGGVEGGNRSNVIAFISDMYVPAANRKGISIESRISKNSNQDNHRMNRKERSSEHSK